MGSWPIKDPAWKGPRRTRAYSLEEPGRVHISGPLGFAISPCRDAGVSGRRSRFGRHRGCGECKVAKPDSALPAWAPSRQVRAGWGGSAGLSPRRASPSRRPQLDRARSPRETHAGPLSLNVPKVLELHSSSQHSRLRERITFWPLWFVASRALAEPPSLGPQNFRGRRPLTSYLLQPGSFPLSAPSSCIGPISYISTPS